MDYPSSHGGILSYTNDIQHIPRYTNGIPNALPHSMKLQIGDRVKLTGKFLKSTGQRTGRAGLDTWTIVGFWGDGNRFALVNEPIDPTGYEDLAPADRPKWRSIAVANLYKVGMLTTENCP